MREAGAPATGPRVANARAVMASRVEPKGLGDYYATPPWATRALCVDVLGIGERQAWSVWEPACGAGHMAVPLAEYFGQVLASDLYDRGFGLTGPEWDFLRPLPEAEAAPCGHDWIITNPPYGELPQKFVERAFELAPRVGIAVFVQLRWLETIQRGRELFLPRPPHVIGIFCDRVPLVRGGWDPDASTATAYCWVVWRLDGAAPRPPVWIPPGAPQRHSRLSDLALARSVSPAADAGPLFGEAGDA